MGRKSRKAIDPRRGERFIWDDDDIELIYVPGDREQPCEAPDEPHKPLRRKKTK